MRQQVNDTARLYFRALVVSGLQGTRKEKWCKRENESGSGNVVNEEETFRFCFGSVSYYRCGVCGESGGAFVAEL